MNRIQDKKATPVRCVTSVILALVVGIVLGMMGCSWRTMDESALHVRSVAKDNMVESSAKAAANDHFAPQCSDEQKKKVAQLFTSEQIGKLSRCPHNTWWDDHLFDMYSTDINNDLAEIAIALSFGCNKGDDAVETLAKLSGDSRIQVEQYRSVFKRQGPRTERACAIKKFSTALESKHPLWKKRPRPTHMYCVEAGVNIANALKSARDEYMASISGANNALAEFTITHAAMGSKDGLAYFEKVDLGSESGKVCLTNYLKLCEQVKMYTVDSYVNEVVEEEAKVIDIMTVDVEGFDWEVLGLGGADETLKKVKYLEFEFNNIGAWKKYRLEDVTSSLYEKFGFICYYAEKGKLWRLTNCFQSYFNKHQWSNVACANLELDPVLANRMERTFQSQLVF